MDNLQEIVPIDARTYSLTVMEDAEVFFSSLAGQVEYIGENIILKKVYADPIAFSIKDFNKTEDVQINEKINIEAYPEILFLTKYLGDYNVTKYGNKTLTLENNGYTLVVERL